MIRKEENQPKENPTLRDDNTNYSNFIALYRVHEFEDVTWSNNQT